tara:strand:- start:71 stop:277 length:207 start_codon:yes stop_codon:yes gene_type:complete
MAQIIPFPFEKIKNKNKSTQFTEKHILHMIKNIRENYPPSLWNTIYQLSQKGHLNKFLKSDNDEQKIQ